LRDSTVTEGNILKGGSPFIHNFGNDNTCVGIGVGNLSMTGDGSNTAIGANALSNNKAGRSNTAIGAFSLNGNTSGTYNTAVGARALSITTSGHANTATGFGALNHNIDGNHNTADGFLALSLNTTGTDNTATGLGTLFNNTTGVANTASGSGTLNSNTTGDRNTAFGANALAFNHSGSGNTAIGYGADVFMVNLNNATAIGQGAFVDASDKIRLGNADVSVIEGPVGFTSSFDRNRQEGFLPVNGEDVLAKIRDLSLGSWNFTGQDAGRLRHYGPAAQYFFAAFGRDGLGTIGTPTTITSTDMDGILMIAAQALEKRTLQREQIALGQAKEIEVLRAENRTLTARLEALERAAAKRR
jgi:hypothetical protein